MWKVFLIEHLYWNLPPLIDSITIKIVVNRLKKKQSKIKSLHDALKISYSFNILPLRVRLRPFTIMPIQVEEEILQLLKILIKYKPTTLMEVGTGGGGTLFLFSRVASSNATIISLDLPEGRFTGGYPRWKIPLYKSFASSTENNIDKS